MNCPSASRQPTQPQRADPARTMSQVASPGVLPPIQRLQRAVGNRGMGRFLNGTIQAKLTVNRPGDPFEREADRVADAVMRMPDPRLAERALVHAVSSQPHIQRACRECDEQQRKEPTVQAKAASGGTPEVTPRIAARIQSLQGTGETLSTRVRSFFEPRFGQEFSHVRVHTDAESTLSLRAKAYTVGSNIVFGAGQYSPETSDGRRLLAHELTHVVQQTGDGRGVGVRNRPGFIQRSAVFDGRILDEGTCANLVAGSKWICCDPVNGMERKGKKKDVEGTDCPSSMFTPIFTCNPTCDEAIKAGCSDSDNWMAMPNSRFARRKCGQDLVICSGGSFTHAIVRDKSEREAWEVSRAIPSALGLSPDFRGVIYPDENDKAFKSDKRCHTAQPTSLNVPGTTGIDDLFEAMTPSSWLALGDAS